jgi:hypothetical protein
MADEAGFIDNQSPRRNSLRDGELLDDVLTLLVELISELPATAEQQTSNAFIRARELIADASLRAAGISGTIALQAAPSAWPVIISELAAIWRLQAQMVADVGAVFGKSGRLTEESIVYCLFRHTAAQFIREFVTGVVEGRESRNSAPATETALEKIGTEILQRITRRKSSRWLPVLGALAVAAYAYYDTDQVGQTAIEFFSQDTDHK